MTDVELLEAVEAASSACSVDEALLTSGRDFEQSCLSPACPYCGEVAAA